MTGESTENSSMDASHETLSRLLSHPRGILLRRRRHAIIQSGIDAAVTLLLITSIALMGALVARWYGLIGASPAWIICAVGLAATILAVSRALLRALMARIDLREIAERVDLQSDGKNRLATALEFIAGEPLTPFRAAAILDAVNWSAQKGMLQPRVPELERPVGLVGRTAALGICIAALALVCRLQDSGTPAKAASGSRFRETVVASPAVGRDADHQETGRSPKNPDRKEMNPPQSAPGDRAISLAAPGQAIPQEQLGAAADQAASPAVGAVPPPEHTPAGQSPGEQNQPRSADGSRALPSIALTDQGAAASGPKNKASSGNQGSSSHAEHESASASENAGEGQSHSNQPKDAKSASPGDAQGQENASPDQDSKTTATGGSGSKNQESTGGEGTEPGAGGGKKARGVNSGLLGVRTADLFIGRELAGPEDRMILPTLPTAHPSTPAPAATGVPRTGDEAQLDLSDPPSVDADLLSQYFHDLHQDSPAR